MHGNLEGLILPIFWAVGECYAVALGIAAFVKLSGPRRNLRRACGLAIFPTVFGIVSTMWLRNTYVRDVSIMWLAVLPAILGGAALVRAFFIATKPSQNAPREDQRRNDADSPKQ